MSEERTQQASESQPGEDRVTHAELDAAFAALESQDKEEAPEEASEETPEETPKEPEEQEEETPELPAEPADNAERTKLGRKVAKLEEGIGSIAKNIETMMQEFKSLQEGKQEEKEEKPSIGDDDVVTTAAEVREIYRREREAELKIQREEQQKIRDFGSNYLSALKEYSDDPDFAEVYKLCTDSGSKFNVITTSDPKMDAELNFHKAKLHLLSGRTETNGKVPVNGGKPPSATGLDVTSSQKPPGKKTPKLSKDAEDFLRHIGKTSDHEWVEEALQE